MLPIPIRPLWLAKRRMRGVFAWDYVNVVVTSRCFASRAHASTNLKKLLSWVFFIYPFPTRLKLGKIFKTCCVYFVFRLSWHFKWEKSVFLKASFFKKKQELIMRTRLRVQDFATGENFSFNQCHNKEFCVFFSQKLSYKSNRKLFFCIWIAWYKHSRGWENSRQLCKPLTLYRLCIAVSDSPNPSCVYIRVFKHWNRFLLLKYTVQ